MKATVPIIICAALALAGCATTSPGPAATATPAAPVDLTQWVGYYYAGTIRYIGRGHARQAVYVMNITKEPNGGYMVHRCFSSSSDYSAKTPEPGMTCLPAPATQQADVLTYTGNEGDTVKLTFSSADSVDFHDLYKQGWVWTGTLDRTSPVPATKS